MLCVSVAGGVTAEAPFCNSIHAPMLPTITTMPVRARISDRFDFFGADTRGASAADAGVMLPVIAGAALGVSIVGSPAPARTPECVPGDIIVGCEPVVIGWWGCGPVIPGNGVDCAIEARANAPLGIARDGVIIGSPAYIVDNGRPARHRANAS